jgi:triphosphatase
LDDLLPHQGLLVANLMTGLSLGNLFDREECTQYRYPWLDIYQGLLELSMLNHIQELALDEENSEVRHEYMKWVSRKQNSLLSAIEQSKQRALTNQKYWLDVEN